MATIFRPPIIVTISPRRKAKEDWTVNIRVQYVVPFRQLDWSLPTKARAKVDVEAVGARLPLYAPNPPRPFNQSEWPNPASARQLPAPDYNVNLLPLQNPVVVAIPFNETNWTRPATPRSPVTSDVIINLLPLQSAPVILPFSLGDWSTVARPRAKAIVDLIERSAPLYTPNPAVPFINPIMMNTNASRRPSAIVDAVVNLLPIQNPPPPGGNVHEWIIRARRRGRR